MTQDLRCEIMEDADALAAVAPAWWALWRRCPAATPFTSPAWALPWWQAFSPGRLRAAAIWDGDALVALAPIYREEGELGRRLLPIGIGISDALDVLVDPLMKDAAGSALVQSVAAHAADWDSWELEELPPGAAALALPVPLGCTEHGGSPAAAKAMPQQESQGFNVRESLVEFEMPTGYSMTSKRARVPGSSLYGQFSSAKPRPV